MKWLWRKYHRETFNILSSLHQKHPVSRDSPQPFSVTFVHVVELCKTPWWKKLMNHSQVFIISIPDRLFLLTVGDCEQSAVRCIQVTRCYIVPLSGPVNGGIVLDVKLLENNSEVMISCNYKCLIEKVIQESSVQEKHCLTVYPRRFQSQLLPHWCSGMRECARKTWIIE